MAALALFGAIVLVGRGDSDHRSLERLERWGERAVAKHIRQSAPKATLSTRCEADGFQLRPSCRWRAVRRKSPNRRRVCQGRYDVGVGTGGRPLLRPRGRDACGEVVRALHPMVGFNDNSVVQRYVAPAQEAQLLENLGVGIVRVTFSWRDAEPRKDALDLSVYDAIYRETTARGIRPLWTVMFAPGWLLDPGVSCSVDCRYPPRRDRLDEWRALVALLARRYPRSAGIEIWNEPNESGFWRPHPDAARYAELLREAYSAIKASNPQMRVLAGGLTARTHSVGGDISLSDFARGLFANGAGHSFDMLSLHAYPAGSNVNLINNAVNTLLAVRSEQGSHAPVWVTETGLTTGGLPSNPQHRTEAGQAAGLVAAYRALAAHGQVGAVLLHTLIDPPGNPVNAEAGFGVVRGDHSLKPAYCALSRELRAEWPCP